MADAREVGAKFLEAFNAHDEERIRQLNAENAIVEAPGDVRVEGREPTTQYAMAWLRAFPDARLTVHNELVDGDWVVQQFTFDFGYFEFVDLVQQRVALFHHQVIGSFVGIIALKRNRCVSRLN